MKNKRWYVLVWMLILSASIVFSGEIEDLADLVVKDAVDKNFDALAESGGSFRYYIICTDQSGIIYIYRCDTVANIVKVHRQTRVLSRQEFIDKLNNSSSTQKRVDDKGYICYSINYDTVYIVQTPHSFVEVSGEAAYTLNPFTASLTNDSTSSSSRIPMPNPNELKSYKQGYLADMDSDDFYRYLYDDTDSSYDDGNDMLEYLYDEANPYTRDRILNFIKQYVSEPFYSRMVSSEEYSELNNYNVIKTITNALKVHQATQEAENGEVWYYVFYDGNDVFLVLSHTADGKWESYVYNIY